MVIKFFYVMQLIYRRPRYIKVIALSILTANKRSFISINNIKISCTYQDLFVGRTFADNMFIISEFSHLLVIC